MRGGLRRGLAAFLVALTALPGAAAGRVVLVGIDGGSWNAIDPLLASGELPQLAALAARGVSAELEAVKPANSPSVWTSIATGRSPAAHGVTDFQATRLTVRVPTLFERLARAGRRVGLYDYLVTWPPAEFEGGFAIPGWLRHDDRVTPAGLWQRIGLPPWVVRYDPELSHGDLLALSRAEFAEKAKRWNQLAAAFDVEVGAVTFYTVDTLSHRFWDAAFPQQFPAERRRAAPVPVEERDAVRTALRGADRSLGVIASRLTPDDTLLVVSDHGFQADRDSPNVWVTRVEPALGRAGLDPVRDRFHLITRFGLCVIQVHEGPFEAREAVLERLLTFLRGWRSLEGEPLFDLHVIDVAPRPPGRKRSVWQRLRQWGVGVAMRHIYHMNTERPGHAYIFALPRDAALAPLWPDGRVALGDAQRPVREAFFRDAFPGKHHPSGIFVAAGGPLQPRAERGRLSVLDVAPLVFYLAGAPIPDDLEGELPRELIAADQLAAHPPRELAAEAMPGLPPPLEAIVPGEDPDLVEKLRRLGYLP